VEKFSVWVAQHRTPVMLLFAALGAIAALNAFRAGEAYGDLRAAYGEAQRAASEALGG